MLKRVLALQSLMLLAASATFGLASASAQELTDQLRQESAAKILQDARQSGDAVRGAILFAQRETACASCHNDVGADRLAPDLRQLPAETSDEHLLESLLHPSRKITKGFELTVVQTTDGLVKTLRVLGEKGGNLTGRLTTPPYPTVEVPLAEIEERRISDVSAMPDGLPDRLESRQQFLDLLRYLMQLRDLRVETPAVGPLAGGGQVPEHVTAAALFDRLNCRACHNDRRWQQVTAGSVSADRAPLLLDVRARLRPEYLLRYLQDPQAAKPGSRMPHVLQSVPELKREQVARELTHFLLSRGDRPFQGGEFNGEQAHRGEELFHSVGCVSCHSPRDSQGQEMLAAESVPLGNVAERSGLAALVSFLEDPSAVRPAGRMPNMQLSHSEAEDLAHYLMQNADAQTAPFAVAAELAVAGEQHYRRYGCAACHEPVEPAEAVQFTIVDADRGCLSDAADGEWPGYNLTETERQLLSQFVGGHLSEEPQPVMAAMATLRCYSCHQRDGVGGVDPDRDEYFRTVDFNLGPQGRIPPPLTGVGNKLNPRWLRQVLVSGRSVRPYMKTRMPRFGVQQVEPLVDLLTAQDDQPDREYRQFADNRERKEPKAAGHQLAGNQGLNCIACHTFQRKPAATMSALDLTEMTERLQRDWFVDYLLQPQRMSPGTVMPSFWPGGRAIRRQILDGDTNQQLEALWVYLEEGRQARVPSGLIQESLQLLATDEAVMLRRSWPGIGKRGIGVGYPEQVNLVFDAEQMRLAMIWKGPFADPGGVWRSQGHGTARPLGDRVVQLAKGPDLTNPAAPWEESEANRRPAGYRFGGYSLDAVRRPLLRYQADGVSVQEFAAGTDQQTLQRTITFTAADLDGPRSFRLLSGTTIEALGDHTWKSDAGLQLQLQQKQTVKLVTTEAGQEVQISLPPGKLQLKLEMVYSW